MFISFLITGLLLTWQMVSPSPNSVLNIASDLEAKVDNYLAPYIDRKDFSGCVLIAKGDSVLLNKAYGMANYELNVPNSPQTKFPIASITKTFTAAAIAILNEQGELHFKDALGKYVANFPYGNKITIRHLLRHESGLSNPDYTSYSRPASLAELVNQIGSRPLLFEPGSDGRYSNAGFNLLAYVVERVSGLSYYAFLEKNIFAPLAMKNTGHDDDDIVGNRASPYLPGPQPAGLVKAPWRYTGLSTGSGSLYSNTHDLYLWARAIRANRFFDLGALEYPYGWGRLNRDGIKGIEQTGLNTGFTSYLALYFDEELYVIVLTNVESIRWTKWGRDLSAIAFEKDYETEQLPQEVKLSSKLLDNYLGKYQHEQSVLTIVEQKGHLWLYSDNWPIGKYLVPVSTTTFILRADFGTLEFSEEKEGRYETLTWTFNENAKTAYRRTQ